MNEIEELQRLKAEFIREANGQQKRSQWSRGVDYSKPKPATEKQIRFISLLIDRLETAVQVGMISALDALPLLDQELVYHGYDIREASLFVNKLLACLGE